MEGLGTLSDPQCEALTKHLPIIIRLRQTGLCSNGAADLIYERLVQTILRAKAGTLLSPGFAGMSGHCQSDCEIHYSQIFAGNRFSSDVQQLGEQITPDTDTIFSAIPMIRPGIATFSGEQIHRLRKVL